MVTVGKSSAQYLVLSPDPMGPKPWKPLPKENVWDWMQRVRRLPTQRLAETGYPAWDMVLQQELRGRIVVPLHDATRPVVLVADVAFDKSPRTEMLKTKTGSEQSLLEYYQTCYGVGALQEEGEDGSGTQPLLQENRRQGPAFFIPELCEFDDAVYVERSVFDFISKQLYPALQHLFEQSNLAQHANCTIQPQSGKALMKISGARAQSLSKAIPSLAVQQLRHMYWLPAQDLRRGPAEGREGDHALLPLCRPASLFDKHSQEVQKLTAVSTHAGRQVAFVRYVSMHKFVLRKLPFVHDAKSNHVKKPHSPSNVHPAVRGMQCRYTHPDIKCDDTMAQLLNVTQNIDTKILMDLVGEWARNSRLTSFNTSGSHMRAVMKRFAEFAETMSHDSKQAWHLYNFFCKEDPTTHRLPPRVWVPAAREGEIYPEQVIKGRFERINDCVLSDPSGLLRIFGDCRLSSAAMATAAIPRFTLSRVYGRSPLDPVLNFFVYFLGVPKSPPAGAQKQCLDAVALDMQMFAQLPGRPKSNPHFKYADFALPDREKGVHNFKCYCKLLDVALGQVISAGQPDKHASSGDSTTRFRGKTVALAMQQSEVHDLFLPTTRGTFVKLATASQQSQWVYGFAGPEDVVGRAICERFSLVQEVLFLHPCLSKHFDLLEVRFITEEPSWEDVTEPVQDPREDGDSATQREDAGMPQLEELMDLFKVALQHRLSKGVEHDVLQSIRTEADTTSQPSNNDRGENSEHGSGRIFPTITRLRCLKVQLCDSIRQVYKVHPAGAKAALESSPTMLLAFSTLVDARPVVYVARSMLEGMCDGELGNADNRLQLAPVLEAMLNAVLPSSVKNTAVMHKLLGVLQSKLLEDSNPWAVLHGSDGHLWFLPPRFHKRSGASEALTMAESIPGRAEELVTDAPLPAADLMRSARLGGPTLTIRTDDVEDDGEFFKNVRAKRKLQNERRQLLERELAENKDLSRELQPDISWLAKTGGGSGPANPLAAPRIISFGIEHATNRTRGDEGQEQVNGEGAGGTTHNAGGDSGQKSDMPEPSAGERDSSGLIPERAIFTDAGADPGQPRLTRVQMQTHKSTVLVEEDNRALVSRPAALFPEDVSVGAFSQKVCVCC